MAAEACGGLSFAVLGGSDWGPDSWESGLAMFALAALAWLLTYALHSTLLLGSAWLATRRLPSARAGQRERVWKFAVLAAFATASLQVGLGFEPLGGRLPLRREAVQAAIAKPEFAAPAVDGAPRELALQDFAAEPEASPSLQLLGLARASLAELLGAVAVPSAPAGGADTPVAGVAGTALANLRAGSAPRLGSFAWEAWAFACCALGAFGGLCLFALLWVRLNGCLRDRVPLEHGPLADQLARLCRRAGLRRKVRLSVAPSLGAPISMGLFRPEICVPPRALLELSEEEQEVLLAHELAHVVRRDPLWLAGCRLCEGVFFFQPLNRVARREIEDCAEFLSDAWAVRQTGLRFSLASCLTRIAEWIVGDRRAHPVPAMAQGRSRLRHRVELLLDETAVQTVERRPAWLGPACVGFGATLIAVVPCVSASEARGAEGDGGGLEFLPERGVAWLLPEAQRESAACIEETAPEGIALDPSPGIALEVPKGFVPEELAGFDPDELAGFDPDELAGFARAGRVVGAQASVDAGARADGADGADEFAALRRELDLLAEDLALLRDEASGLGLRGDLARGIAGELELLETKLANLRELGGRLALLRASPRPAPRAANRAPHPTSRTPVASFPFTADLPTTLSTFEEIPQ